MNDILSKIKEYKMNEIKLAKNKISENEIVKLAQNEKQTRGFLNTIINKKQNNEIALIAEIKKASPSKGIIREKFNVAELAKQYENGGASCISVLTDTPSFQGKIQDIRKAREITKLPVLRKEFIFDPYQVYESRVAGADCILIIMAALQDNQAKEIEQTALELKMDVIVETHNEIEIERAMKLNAQLIGINNRNLKTFKTDINTTYKLAPKVEETRIVISESGLNTHEQLKKMKEEINVGCFLIGEALMKCENVEQETKKIIGKK